MAGAGIQYWRPLIPGIDSFQRPAQTNKEGKNNVWKMFEATRGPAGDEGSLPSRYSESSHVGSRDYTYEEAAVAAFGGAVRRVHGMLYV